MFKLIVLIALLGVTAARPSLVGHTIISEPAVIKVVPAAISHQSHTQIHSNPVLVHSVVHPIVHPALHPVVVHSPIVLSHHSPLLVHG